MLEHFKQRKEEYLDAIQYTIKVVSNINLFSGVSLKTGVHQN